MPAPYNQVRFELDPTGINPDNLVPNEIHNLSSKAIRAISPTYGCFFADSFIGYDNVTQRRLVRGEDYQFVELQQDATLKYGKEIVNVVLIINSDVSHTVRINYQVLGGHYTNDSSAISNMYEAVITDNRAVQWATILNKPREFPPTLHRHLIDDLYGFEPVVAALERIHNALILANVPIIEGIVTDIYSIIYGLRCHEYSKNIPVRKVVTYDKLLAILTRLNVLSVYRFNILKNEIHENGSLTIEVVSDAVADGTVIYWSLFSQTSSLIRFLDTSGTLVFKDNKAYIHLNVVDGNINDINTDMIVIGLKDIEARPDFIAVSCELNVLKSIPVPLDITANICTNQGFTDITEIDAITLLNGELGLPVMKLATANA